MLTDHQAFGEEIGAGIGLRTAEQGFGNISGQRQGYGLTEKDETGLNHTWFRKNENRAGRWTSPDPYQGSMNLANPQSFNRYAYVGNDPTNLVDPSGLCSWTAPYTTGPGGTIILGPVTWVTPCNVGSSGSGSGGVGGGGGILGGGGVFLPEEPPVEGPGGGGGGTIEQILTGPRSDRQIFINNCLKNAVRDRVSFLNRARDEELTSSFVGAMALSPVPPPFGGLLPGSVYGPEVTSNKRAMTTLAGVGIFLNPLGTAANVLGAGAREGTYGAYTFRQKIQAAKQTTEEDRRDCALAADRQGLR